MGLWNRRWIWLRIGLQSVSWVVVGFDALRFSVLPVVARRWMLCSGTNGACVGRRDDVTVESTMDLAPDRSAARKLGGGWL